MFEFLTVVQAIIAAALVGVILMQRSEGGGLGVGGSPSGLMSARGAADLLTRATGILAFLFVALSIALAVIAVNIHSVGTIDQSLDRSPATVSQPVAPEGPADPLGASVAGEASSVAPSAPADDAVPGNADPLAPKDQ